MTTERTDEEVSWVCHTHAPLTRADIQLEGLALILKKLYKDRRYMQPSQEEWDVESSVVDDVSKGTVVGRRGQELKVIGNGMLA